MKFLPKLSRGCIIDVVAKVESGAIVLDPDEQHRLDWDAYSWHLVENAVLEGKGEIPQVRLVRVEGATYLHYGRDFQEDGFRMVRAYPRAEWEGREPHLYRPGYGFAGVLVACGREEFVLGNAMTDRLLVRPAARRAA